MHIDEIISMLFNRNIDNAAKMHAFVNRFRRQMHAENILRRIDFISCRTDAGEDICKRPIVPWITVAAHI